MTDFPVNCTNPFISADQNKSRKQMHKTELQISRNNLREFSKLACSTSIATERMDMRMLSRNVIFLMLIIIKSLFVLFSVSHMLELVAQLFSYDWASRLNLIYSTIAKHLLAFKTSRLSIIQQQPHSYKSRTYQSQDKSYRLFLISNKIFKVCTKQNY